jgi:MoxR-like ATPase
MEATGGTVEAPASALPKGKTTKPKSHKFLPAAAMRQWWRIKRLIEVVKRPIVLAGPPATGKTTFAQKTGEAMGALVIQCTMTPEMPASELLGSQALVNGSFEWQDGHLLHAWRESHKRPVILVLNEVENVSPDAEVALHLALDDADVAGYRVPHTGEVVKPLKWGNGKGFRAIATTNNEMTALSVGVQSRLKIEARADFPAPELVDSLHTDEAKRLVCATAREYDIRTVMAWDEAMRDGEDAEEAAQIIFGDEEARSLLDAIKIDGSR